MRELFKILEKEPSYRLEQAKKALFQDLIEDWSDASNLPLALRAKLNKGFPISITRVKRWVKKRFISSHEGEVFISKDKSTAKTAITLNDGFQIESVLMRHIDGHNTICVSSQVGCSLGCSFCATGKAGLKRNLEVWEIVEQVLFFARFLKKEGKRVNSLVFMGMGEPFLNYENVLEAIKILNDKDGLNIGIRHISISTVGIIEGIRKLAGEKMDVNLAISLHAPDDKLRQKIIPINKKYPIGKILRVVDDYIKKTRRRVMFEYIMIKDFNDSAECATKLARLLKDKLCFVNLITYNPTGDFTPSPVQRVKKFKDILEREGVKTTQRYRFGRDIKAACGQLAYTP